jgi:hypothetical protein
MPMVEYFDSLTGAKKKKEFGYGAVGKSDSQRFLKKQRIEAGRSGYGQPKLTGKYKASSRSSGPDDGRHHPGVKNKDERYPEVKKETKYIQPKKKDPDKKITVGYGGPDYLGMWSG